MVTTIFDTKLNIDKVIQVVGKYLYCYVIKEKKVLYVINLENEKVVLEEPLYGGAKIACLPNGKIISTYPGKSTLSKARPTRLIYGADNNIYEVYTSQMSNLFVVITKNKGEKQNGIYVHDGEKGSTISKKKIRAPTNMVDVCPFGYKCVFIKYDEKTKSHSIRVDDYNQPKQSKSEQSKGYKLFNEDFIKQLTKANPVLQIRKENIEYKPMNLTCNEMLIGYKTRISNSFKYRIENGKTNTSETVVLIYRVHLMADLSKDYSFNLYNHDQVLMNNKHIVITSVIEYKDSDTVDVILRVFSVDSTVEHLENRKNGELKNIRSISAKVNRPSDINETFVLHIGMYDDEVLIVTKDGKIHRTNVVVDK